MVRPPSPPSDAHDHARDHTPEDAPQEDDLALAADLAAVDLLPLPPGFHASVMRGLPAQARPSALPALFRVAAAVLIAILASIAAQGLSPAMARAEAPALLRETMAPVVAGIPRPTLTAKGLPLTGADRVGTAFGLAALGLLCLGGGLFVARRALAGAASSPPPPETRS